METSPSIKELATALCQFQTEQVTIAKGADNPFFKSKYAALPDVLDAVLPELTKCGLCFVQFPDDEALTTRLMHTSGEWMQASYTLKPAQATPQASGSAITYARRYALLAILGLSTEDDDGNAASNPGKGTKTTTAAAPEPVRYATAAQIEEINKLLAHPAITPAEVTKVRLNMPTLDEATANSTIKTLRKWNQRPIAE